MSDTQAIEGLDARHRLEEACEPYRLFPQLADSGELRIALDQFAGEAELSRTLADALGGALTDAGFAAAIQDAELVVAPAGATDLADALDDALYAIRPLAPSRFLGRFSQGAHVPHDDAGEALSVPRSDVLRARLIAGDFMPDDKKPPVLDLHRSSGPYLASVDDEPLILLDAASQIATHAGGLNPPEILEALWTGDFDDYLAVNPDTRRTRCAPVEWLSDRLREGAEDTLPHVALCGSGAEANELALRVAARRHPGRRRIVAFEGAFHGRAMAILHATWNPAKRERFELAGFEARWCPWPTSNGPSDEDAGILAAEDAAFGAVEAALADDQVVAIFVEPMQSEGGERHVSGRFMRRLRSLALARDVPFIIDEVQTGFGLGGPFFWHRRFDLDTPPDLVTVAKKAQVGGVLSRWPIDVATEVHVASAIRGLCQADIIAAGDPEATESDVAERLATLAEAHPTTVLSPRAVAYAFGFDLPNKDAVAHLIGQRLWRGWMLYGAGAEAVRFRLHPHISERALDGMFRRLDRSLTALESGETADWRRDELPDPWAGWPARQPVLAEGYRIERLDRGTWRALRPAITELQAQCYEPARRDDLDEFGDWLDDDALYFAALTDDGSFAGVSVAFPLERVPTLDGPAQDGTRGQERTLYSAEVAVGEAHRGKGLGLALKDEQVAAAMRATDASGEPRYDFITGRNRVGATDTMMGINEAYGGYEASRHFEQYGDPDGTCVYYRIPLTAPRLPLAPAASTDGDVRLDASLVERLSDASVLYSGLHRGVVNGAIANKLSLCNFVTPGVVRAAEMLRASAPNGLAHLVTGSSRAETCDKGLRAIKYHRRQARVVISIGPIRAGETTAASRTLGRSVDDPENWFGWPTTADPTTDPEAALRDVEAAIARDGKDAILAAVIEPVYAATGRAVPESFWRPLRALLDRHGVPLVALEDTTGAGRSGRGLWRADSLPVSVDAVWWFSGGQLGLCFVSDALYVPTKLTLISTWDGDELSYARCLWELRAIRDLDIAGAGERLGAILARLGDVGGEGLYRSVQVEDADGMVAALAEHRVRVGKTESGALLFSPALDISHALLDRVDAALSAILG